MFTDVGDKIKGWARFILVFTIIVSSSGIVTTIVTLNKFFDFEGGGFLLFLIALIEFGFSICIAIFLCQLIYGFGVIVSNHERQEREKTTIYSSNTTSTSRTYNSSLFKDMDNSRAPKGQVAKGEWTCPTCGRVNQNYVGTCGCGTTKNAVSAPTTEGKYLFCPKCGQKQDASRTTCFKCGAEFPQK